MRTLIIMGKIGNFILDTLFPIHCQGCGLKDSVLCDECILKIKLNDRETEKNIISVFDYRDQLIKDIIWNLKYHKQKSLGERLGQILFDFSKDQISEMKFLTAGKPIIVIPVPCSRKRLMERGYNHTEILAKWFCNEDKNNLEFIKNAVFKKLETKHQAKITNKRERLQNIKDTFGINPNISLKGRSIIVIDDVTTTGGTFLEILKILRKAGAKTVLGVALAH